MTDLLLSLASVLLFAACSCGVVLVLASVAHDRDHLAEVMAWIAGRRPVRLSLFFLRSFARWCLEVHP